MGGYGAAIGGAAGAGLATLGALGGGPAGAMIGLQIGATFGTIAEALFSKPTDQNKNRDARWGGVTYGTSISRGWGSHRTDAYMFWGVRNKDGSYLFAHNQKKRKKGGSGNVAHFHATFAFLTLETGLTYADGTQVERRIVIDRVWMADMIVWQSATAVPILAWDSTKTYNYGDYVTRVGDTFTSISDANLNHLPFTVSLDIWWQKVSTGKNWDITFHPDDSESTFTQAVDSTMATHDGIANTPAMRGSTYGLCNDVDLYQIGNALPGNISVEWHWATPATLGDLLTDACGLCGLPTGSYDFSDLTTVLTGYRQTARQSGADMIATPLSIKGYDLASIDGVVRAVKRGGSSTVTIPLGDLGGVLDGSERVDRLSESILADPSELHSSLKLGYFDASAGFRQSYQTATRNGYVTQNPTDIATDMVMTADEGAQGAGMLLDTEWLEAGAEFSTQLLGGYTACVSSDPVTLPYRGRNTRFRITGTEYVQNRILLKLARDEPEVLVRYETGSVPLASASDNGAIIPTAFAIASTPVDLSNDFAAFPGFMVFGNGPEGWLGGQVVFTFDAPTVSDREWVSGPFATDPSTFGFMTSALASASGYDTTSTATLTVTMAASMSVPPSSQSLVNNGAQNALIGNEIVGVVGATDLGGGSYQIGPNLARGMRGSPTTGHAIGDLFASSSSVAATAKVQVDPAYIGDTVYVQVLSPGQDIGDSPELTCVIASPTSPYVTNGPPVSPSSISAGTPVYSVANEVVSFTATLPSAPPAGQHLAWQSSTDSGSTWSTSTIGDLTFTAPAFGSGHLRVRAQAVASDGRTAAWVSSSDVTYSAPPTPPTPFQEVPTGTVDGVNTAFGLTHAPIAGSLILFDNGDPQVLGTAYTLAGSTIMFAAAPVSGHALFAAYSY